MRASSTEVRPPTAPPLFALYHPHRPTFLCTHSLWMLVVPGGAIRCGPARCAPCSWRPALSHRLYDLCVFTWHMDGVGPVKAIASQPGALARRTMPCTCAATYERTGGRVAVQTTLSYCFEECRILTTLPCLVFDVDRQTLPFDGCAMALVGASSLDHPGIFCQCSNEACGVLLRMGQGYKPGQVCRICSDKLATQARTHSFCLLDLLLPAARAPPSAHILTR